MFKKSFIAVMSALAITASGMATTASAAFSQADSGNSNGIFAQAEQTDMNKIRKIPYRLACSWAGIGVTSNYDPNITSGSDYMKFQSAMNRITGSNIAFQTATGTHDWYYWQNGYNYGYENASRSCATFAFATALSIYNKTSITPDKIATNSPTDGWGTVWGSRGATLITKGDYPDLTDNEIFLAIDAQLAMGRPAIIHVYTNANDQHYATVIAKDDTQTDVGKKYTIVDPAKSSGTGNGKAKECLLEDMAYYTGNNIDGYVILSEALT